MDPYTQLKRNRSVHQLKKEEPETQPDIGIDKVLILLQDNLPIIDYSIVAQKLQGVLN